MKKELREILHPRDKFTILGEKKSGDKSTITALVPWAQADEETINKRIYPKALLQREVDRVQAAVEAGSFIGTGDHPKSGLSDIKTASHIINKIWMDEGGRGWAKIKILDTERGKNIQSLIKGGAQLGISTRGFGQVGKSGRVDDDYKLMGIDIVMNPSVKSATFSKANIFESVDFEEEEKVEPVKKTKIIIDEKKIMAALKVCYDSEVAEYGLTDCFEHYKKKKLAFVTSLWLVENYPARFSDVNKALAYLVGTVAAGKLAKEYAKEDEEIITHYEITPQLANEAFMLNIPVEEYVKKLNETVGRPKADIPAREAQESGLAGETRLVEKMMEYPDGEKRIAYVSEKVDVHKRIEEARKIKLFPTEEEELAKEAQRIFRIEKATNPKTEETVETIIQMLKAEKKRVQDEREAFKKNRLAEQIKESIAGGGAGELKEYEE